MFKKEEDERREYRFVRIVYLRATQGHSGEDLVEPCSLDNVSISENYIEVVNHVGRYFNMHSIVASGLIAGGKNDGRDRQTVVFTAVDPKDKNWNRAGRTRLDNAQTCCFQANVESKSRCCVSEQPVVFSSGMLDFRIQSLLHSKVEHAEQGRVRDLINQIESHLYQDDLQADLRQNNVYNPFREVEENDPRSWQRGVLRVMRN